MSPDPTTTSSGSEASGAADDQAPEPVKIGEVRKGAVFVALNSVAPRISETLHRVRVGVNGDARDVTVILKIDLDRVARQLAWSATRSRQRPRRSSLAGGKIVCTVVAE